MELKIRPIINDLFYATATYESLEATAIGHTKDEAAKKALEWLKREIEVEEARDFHIETDEDCDLKAGEYEFYGDHQALFIGEFLKDEIWNKLEEEVQELAVDLAKIAFKAPLRYIVGASVGHSAGGLFF